MTPRRQRIAGVAGAVLFAAAVAAGLLHVPERPLRAYRAVPSRADFVSVHARPADRLEDLFGTPGAGLIAQAFGLAPDDWDRFRAAEETHRWARRLADRKVVFASYPADGGRRVWLFASDLGGRALRLRALLRAGGLPGFRRAGTHAGRTLWTVDAGAPGDLHLSFAFEEGLLIGCWSDRWEDLVLLLDTYDRARPSIVDSGLARGLEDRPGVAPDRAWWRGSADLGTGPVWADLDAVDAGGLRGRMEFPHWRGRVSPPAREAGMSDAVALFGSVPDAVLAADPEWLIGLAAAQRLPAPVALALTYLRREVAPPGALALFGGPASGRLFGMRVPGIVFASALRKPDDAPRVLAERVDRINASCGTAISLGPVSDPPGPLLSMSLPDVPVIGRLPTAEQPGLALRDGRFYAATNLDTLRVLLAAPRGAPSASDAPDARAAAVFRIDLREGGAAIRNGLSVYALALMMQSREGTRETRALINRIRDALELAEPLEQVAAALRFDAEGLPALEVTVGSPGAAP